MHQRIQPECLVCPRQDAPCARLCSAARILWLFQALDPGLPEIKSLVRRAVQAALATEFHADAPIQVKVHLELLSEVLQGCQQALSPVGALTLAVVQERLVELEAFRFQVLHRLLGLGLGGCARVNDAGKEREGLFEDSLKLPHLLRPPCLVLFFLVEKRLLKTPHYSEGARLRAAQKAEEPLVLAL